MRGLTLEDWTKINSIKPEELGIQKEKLILEMRKKYYNNPYALEQLDIFDGDSPYKKHFRILKKALFRPKNESIIKEELEWFAKNYPLIEKYGTGEP